VLTAPYSSHFNTSRCQLTNGSCICCRNSRPAPLRVSAQVKTPFWIEPCRRRGVALAPFVQEVRGFVHLARFHGSEVPADWATRVRSAVKH
jgi:hypothetical protein